jgi:hypothetical protein
MTTTAKTPRAHCLTCRAALYTDRSVTRQRGDRCYRKYRAEQAAARLATAAGFKDAEAATTKALALIADKGLVPTRHTGQYLAVASKGDAAYLVDTVERTCTCRGHHRTGRCYHLLAADVAEHLAARRNAYALAA